MKFSVRDLFLLGAIILVGCHGDDETPVNLQGAIPGLGKPDKLTVYSLDPHDPSREQLQQMGYGIGEWRVLGKVEVEDVSERHRIADAIQDAVVHPDGDQYKCFEPRHAIRVEEKGKTLEIVICFQCRNYSLNGAGITPAIARDAKAKEILNAILTKAGIQLAPESEEDAP